MLKIRKFLKIIFIFSPVIVFFSCGETVTQAEKLLTGENKEVSPYVKIDEKTKSFTLDLSTSRIEKLEKSAFFSLKSRFYQKLNAQSLDEKNTNDSKSNKSNGEKINFYFLSKIIFPDSLIEIEDYAFYVDSANLTKCEKILELDFSKANKLQKIGNFAFQGNNVKTLVLPPSIKSIGKQAFAKNQLEQVDFSQAKKLEEIQTGAFFDNKIKELDFSANSNLVEIFPGSFESNQIEKVKFNINSKPIIIRNSVFKDNVIKTEVGIENLPKNSKLENIFS
ncbi:leucine-rich repeat domain-containing protein [Mycoplasma flocculare]|uniref:leucine-rich repeat domain-containing protein n=1 Tax=Mesomycoplasma flocculare TaxID=2128 RepID=UPI00136CD4A9|nr:leucine-rich repeat domain-containing protein [Mesomycoplasma flocculare]MXR13376.1 leucine-rich repeat domain-containing protein [Mesomycoplasma flocculare]